MNTATSTAEHGSARSSLCVWPRAVTRQNQAARNKDDDELLVRASAVQSRDPYLFGGPARRQGNDLFFSAIFLAHLAQKPGFCVSKTPGFRSARAAIERLVERLSRFGRKKKAGGFLMARGARSNYFEPPTVRSLARDPRVLIGWPLPTAPVEERFFRNNVFCGNFLCRKLRKWL